jgi:hypothetical protein
MFHWAKKRPDGRQIMSLRGILMRGLLAAGLFAVALSGTASAQVEEERVTRGDLTRYIYQAMVAQHPDQKIEQINAVIFDGELTGYRVTYTGGATVEFTSDGHVVGRNPDTEQRYDD